MSLKGLTLGGSAVSANADLTATVSVKNDSGVAATGLLVADINDSLGNIVARVPGLSLVGASLQTISLDPGQTLQGQFRWNAATFAAGNYSYTAKLLVAGSIGYNNIQGTVVDSLAQGFKILSSPAFSGSVTANPPVLRAGLNVPVHLSALIQNTGNTPLPQQSYQLSVVDAGTGTSIHTQSVLGSAILLGQIQPLAFADWTPTTGGSFRVELRSPATTGSLITTRLFIGDASVAAFTVNRPVVPTGTQTVRATLKVTGADVANGSVSDPLAPLVKQAVIKAVNYADNFAYNHYVNDLKCFACHVQTQAVVGGERNLRFALPLNPLKRSALMDRITQGLILFPLR